MCSKVLNVLFSSQEIWLKSPNILAASHGLQWRTDLTTLATLTTYYFANEGYVKWPKYLDISAKVLVIRNNPRKRNVHLFQNVLMWSVYSGNGLCI